MWNLFKRMTRAFGHFIVWVCLYVIIIIIIVFGFVSILSLTLSFSLPHNSLMDLAHLSFFQPIHHFLTHQVCITSFSILTLSLSLPNSSSFSEGFFVQPLPSVPSVCLTLLPIQSFPCFIFCLGRFCKPSTHRGRHVHGWASNMCSPRSLSKAHFIK